MQRWNTWNQADGHNCTSQAADAPTGLNRSSKNGPPAVARTCLQRWLCDLLPQQRGADGIGKA